MNPLPKRSFVFANTPKPRYVDRTLINEREITRWLETQRKACEQVPSRCILTTVYYAEGARNAWQGTLSGGAYEESFAFDFESAAAFVHMNRVQGTSWIIKKRPACVFLGEDFGVLITGEHGMLRHAPFHVDPSSLCAVAEAFEKRGGYRLFVEGMSYPAGDEQLAAFVPANRRGSGSPWVEAARTAETRAADWEVWQTLSKVRDDFTASVSARREAATPDAA